MKKGLSTYSQAQNGEQMSEKLGVFCSDGLHPDVYFDPNEMVCILLKRIEELEAELKHYKKNKYHHYCEHL